MANQDHAGKRAVRDIGAGTVAGVCQILSVYPFDTIKTRLQTAIPGQRFDGAFACAKTTVRNEGFRGLYKGMAFPFFGISVINTWIFMVNGQAKRFLRNSNNGSPLNLAQLCGCGAFTGLSRTIITTPLELVKTQLQVQYGWKGDKVLYKGPFDFTKAVLREYGLKGMYRGLGATIMRDVPAVCGWFGGYEGGKKMFASLGVPNAIATPLAGSVGGISFWLACIAQDTVKSVIQTTPLNKKAPSIGEATKIVLSRGGPRALFRGLGTSLVRAIPAGGITFIAYEYAGKMFDNLLHL
jgi:solute carrier family 25 carnitine/acylcarnitine transporter 20/29